MKHINSKLLLNSITVALLSSMSTLVFSGDFSLQNANTKNVKKEKWVCKYCPEVAATKKSITVNLSKNSAENGRFANASKSKGDSVTPNVDIFIDSRNKDKHYRFQATALGQDNQSASVLMSQYNDYRFAINYKQLNHYGDFNALTPFVNPGAEQLQLPENWQRVGSTHAMSIADFNNFDNELERKKWQLTLEKNIQEQILAYIDISQETKQGIASQSGNILSKIVLLPQGVDQQHQQLDLGSYLQFKQGVLLVNYYHSKFDNDAEQTLWQSPYSALPGGAQYGQLSRAPDNSLNQLSIFGRYHNEQLQLQARVNYGQLTQDQTLLPYTTTTLPVNSLPITSLDGEVNNLSVHTSGRYKASNNWQFNASYRFDKRNNNTAMHSFEHVLSDSFLFGDSQLNMPYSVTKKQTKLVGQWRFQPNAKFSFGYTLDDKERDYQDRNNTEEQTTWLKLSSRLPPFNNVSFEFAQRTRDGSNYQRVNQKSLINPALAMHKYNVADRDRNEIKAKVTFMPFALTQVDMMGHYQRDHYDNTDIGLVENNRKAFDISISHQINPQLTVTVYSHNQWQDNISQGSYWYDSVDWLSANKDKSDSVGLSINSEKLLDGKLTLAFDYQYSYAQGDNSGELLTTDNQQRQHDLTVNSQEFTVQSHYQFSENISWNIDLLYQIFDENDWRFDYGANQIVNVLGNGLASDDFNEYRLSTGVSYQF